MPADRQRGTGESRRRPAVARAASLLDVDPDQVWRGAYLDLMRGGAPPPDTLAQRLMHSRVVPAVYERWWRPALARVAKGVTGPSMAQEIELARELLALRQGATVLDIACGPGNFTRRFAEDVGVGGTVVGVDVSATMLARAVEDTDAPQVVYVRADVTDLRPRPDVDAVCCFAALHLFADPEAALDVMAAALAPAGRLAILTSAEPTSSLGAPLARTIAGASGMRLFGRDELTAHLQQRGLTVTYHRTFGAGQLVGARRA